MIVEIGMFTFGWTEGRYTMMGDQEGPDQETSAFMQPRSEMEEIGKPKDERNARRCP